MLLFEKLGGLPTAQCEKDAVIRSLEELFNTRPSYGAFVEGYGMPLLSDFRTDILLESYLQELIERWEPRIEAPAVEGLGRDNRGRLHLRIVGSIGGAECALRLMLDSGLFEASVAEDM